MIGPPRPLPGDPIDRVIAARERAWEQNRADYPQHEWGTVDHDGWPASFPLLDLTRLRRWLHAIYRYLHIEPRS